MATVLDIVLAIITATFYILQSAVLFFIEKKEKSVKDDIVLVTGAGSGIGRLLAQEFAKLGATLVLWDVNTKSNLETADIIREKGGKVFAYTCDLSNKDDIYNAAGTVKSEVGKVSILVNNAGIVSGNLLMKTPDHMIEKTYAINIMAHFWIVKCFLPDMIAMKKGHIVTVASLGGLFGHPRLVDYCSSQFAAVGLNDSLKCELRQEGHDYIHTTVICPYFINTGMFEGAKSRFVKFLKPKDVSHSIVKAVLTNTEEVILPKYFSLLLILRYLVPTKVNNTFSDLLTSSVMDCFRGRERSEN